MGGFYKGEGQGGCGPSFSLGFILKTVVTNRLWNDVAQSGLCCGYGARFRCRRKFFSAPSFSFFFDTPLIIVLLQQFCFGMDQNYRPHSSSKFNDWLLNWKAGS